MFGTEPSRKYRLTSSEGDAGILCEMDGLFAGPVPLLRRERTSSGEKIWMPHSIAVLNHSLSALYGLPIDFTAKIGGLRAAANALNKGDLCLARIAAVQLGLPDPPQRPTPSEGELVKLVASLCDSNIIQRDWNPSKHPRWPSGDPERRGGEFAPANAAGQIDGSSSVVPADIVLDPPFEIPWRAPALPRAPAYPRDIAPPLPNTQEREGVPKNPYPSRPECADEWNDATAFCLDLQGRGLLGKGDYRNMGKNLWECIMGQVSEECGGNGIGA